MLTRFSSDFGVEAPNWTHKLAYNSNCSKPNGSANLFGRSLANRTFCKSSNLFPTFKPPAQAPPLWQQIFALAEMLNKFQLNRPAWKSTSKNNFDTQYCNCSISNTSFSICTCSAYPERLGENYKTLHRLVPLRKSSRRATRKSVEGMISRPLLREVTYGMLPLLPTMQGPFRYRRRHWVKPYPICRLFSSWADQFPLAPAQMSGSSRTLTLDQFQGFSSKESRWLPSFR